MKERARGGVIDFESITYGPGLMWGNEKEGRSNVVTVIKEILYSMAIIGL